MNWLNSILILLVAFVAIFLEATFGGFRYLLGAQIDLLPALMVYAGLSAGLPTIAALAILGGLAFDSLSANMLGVTIMPLFATGYIIYLRRGLILRDQLFAQFCLGLIASAVVPVAVLLLLSLARQAPMLSWVAIWQLLVMSFGGAVLTPVCFRLFDGLNHALNYRPVVESSFRLDRQIKRGRK
jgi:rod shape-determining protein MreD